MMTFPMNTVTGALQKRFHRRSTTWMKVALQLCTVGSPPPSLRKKWWKQFCRVLHCSLYLFQYEIETYTGSSSVSIKARSVSKLSSSSNGSPWPWLTCSIALWHIHTYMLIILNESKISLNAIHGINNNKYTHLNLMRLVQMRGGMKNVSTSLEMAVSVLIAPHQTLVSRACARQSR